MQSRDEALKLLEEWVPNPLLRNHMKAVEAAMRWYARKQGANEDEWGLAGLMHDMDWEKHPTREEHPFVAVRFLRERGDVDEEILEAILAHAEYSGTPRTTPMARTLFAVDELPGFIVACAKVRPDGVATLEPKSVKKKLKAKEFAAAVSRADIATGIAELGVDETQHIQTCIDAIRGERERLGV